MRILTFTAFTLVFAAMTISGCSQEERNPVYRVIDKLAGSTKELSDEILVATSKYVEAEFALKSCEKHDTNVPKRCAEFKIKLARTAAYLCGLQTNRAYLYKVIENKGEPRGVILSPEEGCNLD